MQQRRVNTLLSHLCPSPTNNGNAQPTAAPPLRRVLIANRGEISIRIARCCTELGVGSVAVCAADEAEAGARHTTAADACAVLPGRGVAAYLNQKALLDAAQKHDCDAVAPGYGFLSENAEFARAVEAMGLTWVGPAPDTIELFGDKTLARGLAAEVGIESLPGTDGAVDAAGAMAFYDSLRATPRAGPNMQSPAVMLKAVAGGGGRGMREVHDASELQAAFERCASEAGGAFGDARVFVERLLPRARHVEVQVLGDGRGNVAHLYERDCSLQRHRQKLIEIAPCPEMHPVLRGRLIHDALKLARRCCYRGAGTVEFLVEPTDDSTPASGVRDPAAKYWFMEMNPRLQVEHTVTEELLGKDIVAATLRVAGGATLSEIGFSALDSNEDPTAVAIEPPRGFAVQCRVCAESMSVDAESGALQVRAATGVADEYQEPGGFGVRVDSCGSVGFAPSPAYDSLIAKVICRSTEPHVIAALSRARRALADFHTGALKTNLVFLRKLLEHPGVVKNDYHTTFIAERAQDILPTSDDESKRQQQQPTVRDPLAVLSSVAEGGTGAPVTSDAKQHHLARVVVAPPGMKTLPSHLNGQIVSLSISTGDHIQEGQEFAIISSMKMEHVAQAVAGGVVAQIVVAEGDIVEEGDPIAFITVAGGASADDSAAADSSARKDPFDVSGRHVDVTYQRADLEELRERKALLTDARRKDQRNMKKRRALGMRTARENVDDLLDKDSFAEYAPLIVAGQLKRRDLDDLMATTPADGMIGGLGTVNRELFPDPRDHRCAVCAYDYTVLAGTQGLWNHIKKDRLFQLAKELMLPVFFFAEGGGGRPGDTDGMNIAGLSITTFAQWGELSGLVPLVGITTGYCFAGNAVILGCCDVIIATHDSNIGLGGPAMIEGGGLGVFHPKDVGPLRDSVPSGVVDIVVPDEAAAVVAAKRYISYFQGRTEGWRCADQRQLRHVIPENRLRAYEVRTVIGTLCDTGSVLELRDSFGIGMVTALARIEGRPVGIVANNCKHLSGAIDSDAADKAARFMNLCDCHGVPLLFLCDCPGFMVGPDAERSAGVRHCCRMVVTGGALTVPTVTIITRKAYGLGAQAMACGGFRAPLAVLGWPTTELGGMGLEGAVKLGQRKELEAVQDLEKRAELYEAMVAGAYEAGKGLNAARVFEIDDVIDPADTRKWVLRLLDSSPRPTRREPGSPKKRHVDTW